MLRGVGDVHDITRIRPLHAVGDREPAAEHGGLTAGREHVDARVGLARSIHRSHDEAPERVALALVEAGVAVYVAHMRSEEHTSELQSLMRISYAVFCSKKKNPEAHTIHVLLLLRRQIRR